MSAIGKRAASQCGTHSGALCISKRPYRWIVAEIRLPCPILTRPAAPRRAILKHASNTAAMGGCDLARLKETGVGPSPCCGGWNANWLRRDLRCRQTVLDL